MKVDTRCRGKGLGRRRAGPEKRLGIEPLAKGDPTLNAANTAERHQGEPDRSRLLTDQWHVESPEIPCHLEVLA